MQDAKLGEAFAVVAEDEDAGPDGPAYISNCSSIKLTIQYAGTPSLA